MPPAPAPGGKAKGLRNGDPPGGPPPDDWVAIWANIAEKGSDGWPVGVLIPGGVRPGAIDGKPPG